MSWFELFFAFITMVMTCFMAFIAWKALNTWRIQKNDEIIIEGNSNILPTLALFKKLTNFEEIVYQNYDDTDGYKGAYKGFFIKDFLNNLSPELILISINSYNQFTIDSIEEQKQFLYNTSKISTYSFYKGDSNYIKYLRLKEFYSNIILKFKEFESNLEMLKVELVDEHDPNDDDKSEIDFAKTIIQKLIKINSEEYKILKKIGDDILLNL